MTTPPSDTTDLIRRRVINVVGHELRTPISTVRGLAELLIGADEDEARDVIIPALIRNARRSEDLLDDLLIVSEIKTAHPVDEAASIDLGEIARSVARHTIVRVEGEPAGPAHGHRDTVARALQHLVSNAVKYHQAEPWIHFEADDDTVSAVVVTPVDGQVADVELSFEVFFRGESAVTRAAGLGIGLPAARALARVDDGDVTVESTPTQFVARLQLPRSPLGVS
ncbi:sensor histidine kinase [Actinospongicola halichondriae]|uniref:sensor histidine kinase n=1 Tax=Actinospongicola halichondriae TaxID=3236844 RepID=UPI003D462EA0